jgi:serine/threonine protein kinase
MISKDRWEKVETIYHAALARDPETRDSFVLHACGDDLELRSEVESLLKFDDASDKFIETPAIELEAKAIADDENAHAEQFLLKEIGPYRIESIISRGGMGDVFLAIDTRLERKVAIKLLKAQFTADADRIARFKQEARTTSTLSHVNIVTVFEIGEIKGRHYIVTEYVEGDTLRQLISGSANLLSFKQVVAIAIQVVDALDAAHRAGVVHRDIKPENIVVRKDGLVKVLDFGIAKLTATETDTQGGILTTQTGMIMGTASYMSPEQARGQKVDHRTDIFSTGATLYEMLSGKRPFQGETAADVMAAVLVKDPTPLNVLDPNISTSARKIVERCLEKVPEQRFQTTSDLAFCLRELNTDPGNDLTSASVPAFSGRHLGVVSVGTLVLTLIIGAILWKNQRAPQIPDNNSATPTPAPTKFTTRLAWFDRAGNQLGIAGPPGEYTAPALSPKEDRLVVGIFDPITKSRDLWIFPLMSETGTRFTTDPADELNPVWTPDGKWIIYTSDKNGVRNIYRKAVDGSGLPEPLLVSRQISNVEDISQDGKLVISNTGSANDLQPNLSFFSMENRTSTPFRVTKNREDCGHISPDRRWVVCVVVG